MRKNEMFVIIDSLFSERMDYWIELLLVFLSRFSRIDYNIQLGTRYVRL